MLVLSLFGWQSALVDYLAGIFSISEHFSAIDMYVDLQCLLNSVYMFCDDGDDLVFS